MAVLYGVLKLVLTGSAWHYVLPRMVLQIFFLVTAGRMEDSTLTHHAAYQTHSWAPLRHASYLNVVAYIISTGQWDWFMIFSHHSLPPPPI